MTRPEDPCPRKVIAVGNCAPDNYSLGRMLNSHFNIEFVTADTRQQAEKLIDNEAALILVNRVFDYDSDDGIEYIGKIKSDFPEINVMLISNFADAQNRAVSTGALNGFGKSELNDPATIDLLKKVLS